MRKFLFTLLCIIMHSMLCTAQTPSVQWHWKKGTIVTKTPKRDKGQQEAVGLRCAPIPTVRVAFVGLGMRGPGAVERFTHIPGVEIKALCDYEKNRAEACLNIIKRSETASNNIQPNEVAIYYGAEGYKDVCEREDIDLVYVATDWQHHFPVAVCALTHGKHVAIEVPSAMNVAQCWTLIDLVEKNRLHCMILENCCYDWFEMNTLNMVQHGVFGEVIRAQGAYIHTLDPYWEEYWKNPDGTDADGLGWRLKYNMENRGDVYPTHGLGPVAQCLDIHRGDRITTLVAMDTKSVHGQELVEKKTGKPCTDFRNGDHTTTLLRTQLGKNIEIQHNVMTPQPYNRLYQITGTRGFANKYPIEGYSVESHSFMNDEQKNELISKYEHPILKRYGKMAKEVGGHGGMDFIMDCRLVYCLQNGLPLDMDVYDLAEWCSLAELGALSMDNGCAPVAFPDFTRGYWQKLHGFHHAYATGDEP